MLQSLSYTGRHLRVKLSPLSHRALCSAATVCRVRHDQKREVSYPSHLTYSHSALLSPSCPQHVTHRSYHWKETVSHYVSLECTPVRLAHDMLVAVHDYTGLPWWMSLALSTVLLRSALTLPLSVYTSHIAARLAWVRKEQQVLGAELAQEVRQARQLYDWTEQEAAAQFRVNMKRLYRNLIIQENCHPFKMTIVAWVQFPLWISLSLALRNMTGTVPFTGAVSSVLHPDLAWEGTLWFSNLLVPDSTWIIPCMLGLSTLAITEMNALSTVDPPRLQRILTYFLRGLSILMVPISATVPSCLSFYWLCSSLFGLCQNIAFKFPTVQRLLWMPRRTEQSTTPFRDMLRQARIRYLRIKDKPQ